MLTNMEKETIIIYNEADPSAEVFTYNSTLQRRLAALEQQRPQEVTRTARDDTDGQTSVTYTLPKTWVKINPPPVLSEKQREARRAAAKRMFEHRQAAVSGENSFTPKGLDDANDAEPGS